MALGREAHLRLRGRFVMRPLNLGFERQALATNVAERLGVSGTDLIEQYRQIHAAGSYGKSSVKSLRFLRPEIALLKPHSIIDYGCGQSRFMDELRIGYPADLIRYDPAIPTSMFLSILRKEILMT
jgi:hypothetical protein